MWREIAKGIFICVLVTIGFWALFFMLAFIT